jgi:CRISPR-associated endoribonuclease Cas6
MPFSLLLQGYPKTDVPVSHVQGPALQGMFLHLMQAVDPAVSARLHNDDKYRPYTLSPLGVGEPTPIPSQEGNFQRGLQGFWLPRESLLRNGTPCYLRITLLEDDLFPTFGRYFLDRAEPTFVLGETEFVVTGVLNESTHPDPLLGGEMQARRLRSQDTHSSPLPGGDIQWSQYLSYAELINRASQTNRRISLRFLTPTSFRRGKVDFPLPDPRLVFQSYRKRFEEFYAVAFLSDFEEQVEFHTGIANLKYLETGIIKTKNVSLLGFTGRVTYEIDRQALPDLVFQMNLLAEYAFFCGTGRKTTVGMGQTIRIKN